MTSLATARPDDVPAARAPSASQPLDAPPTTPAEVIARYARPGPRYTSYPTAPHFRADASEAERAAVAHAWATATAPLALYAHVPYCERRCLYCGCHVQIARDRGLGVRYVDDLIRELDVLAGLTPFDRPLELLAFGGGTPTWLAPEDFARLVRAIDTRTATARDREWSVEVDPRSVDDAYMALLLELGFNRFSFGVQDLNAEVMQAVGRKQGVAEVRAATQAVGALPFNIDLMYGLPHQTLATQAATIAQVLELGPSRLALFGYAHVPWMKKHQLGLERHGLPDDHARLELYLAAREQLLGAGYVAIGIDHFARPDDALAVAQRAGQLHRNFMGYTVRPHLDLVATGVSGISQVNGTFTANAKDVPVWRDALDRGQPAWQRMLHTSPEDQLRSAVIMDLMGNFAVDKAAIGARFGVDFDQHFAEELAQLAPFVADGLVTETEDRVALSELGALVVRNVAMVFDQWLGQSQARYSRTV